MMIQLRLPIAAFLLAIVAMPANAQDPAAAAQQTIERQLRSFLAGDDAAAYALAAPTIKQLFPTQDQFMAMVRKAYPPVHQPQNFAFGRTDIDANGRISQQVFLVGPDGKDYEALYTLELQPDGVYRITGVSLRAGSTLST